MPVSFFIEPTSVSGTAFLEPSMDDIAAEADYTRRSLYRFLPSKEELGIALALRSCRAEQGVR